MGRDLELFGRRSDGSVFPVEVSLSPSQVNNQPVVMAFVIDITERKKREQVELSMGRLFDQSFNELYLFDSKSLKFVRVNQAAIDNTGYSMNELLQMTPLDLKLEYSAKSFEEKLKPLREKSSKIRFETKHWRKDGSVYPIEVHLELASFDLKPAFMAIILDITDRILAERKLMEYRHRLEVRVEERTKELRESQKLYSAIARNFPEGMISVFDKDLRYVFVEGKELYAQGITSEMLVGTYYPDRLPPEVAEQTEAKLKEVFHGEARSIDIRFRSNDYVLDAVPISDEDGIIHQILVIEKNVTKRKKAEEQVRRALEHERELSELKSRFVSTASHEFRTPLSTILSSVSLLSRYTSLDEKEKRDKHIQRIKGAVHNLTGILNDFLSLDKLESGMVKGSPVIFNFPEFIQEVCDQLTPTLKKGQYIKFQHTGDSEIYLDKQVLNNILVNLLSNASKYSGQKPVKLLTGLSDGQLSIAVEDQGIGISKEDQKHLFERFFRSKDAINIPGTGLGLNIVKKYLDLMDGTIETSSVLGEGSIFTVRLNQPLKYEKDTID
jgi:PAS domain S-box-containing protein